jgi:archaellum biogenesis ATPase FlaH
MNTSDQKSVMVQKYPEFGKLTLDDPCCNNLKEVYNYKLDGNYNGLMSNANFYSMKKEITTEPVIEKLHIEEKGEVLKEQIAINLTSEVINPIQETSDNVEIANKPSDFSQDLPDVAIENLKKETSEIQIPPKDGPKVRFTGDELLNLDTSSYKDIVEELIPTAEISVLAGKGGIGKSLLYQELCLSICLNINEFLGRKISVKHFAVLIIATEDNERRISSRIKKQLKKIAPDAKSIPGLVVITTRKDLIKTIRTEFGNKHYDLVVIDALGDVLSDESYSGSAVRDFYDEFEQIMREFGTTFLVVHHENKSASRDGRTRILGSVAIVDRARSVFMLSKDNKTGLRTLTIEKSNNISDDKIGKPTYLKFDPETLAYSVIEEPKISKDKKITYESGFVSGSGFNRGSKPGRKRDQDKWAQFVKLRQEGEKQNEIAKLLNVCPATISRWEKKYREATLYDTSRVGDVG